MKPSCNAEKDGNPHYDAKFPTIIDLWAAYAEGYLSGKVSSEDPSKNKLQVVVVRFEDILECPDKVVGALAEMGLERNSRDFETVEDSCGQEKGIKRSQIIGRVEGEAIQQKALLESFRDAWSKHEHLLRALGYHC